MRGLYPIVYQMSSGGVKEQPCDCKAVLGGGRGYSLSSKTSSLNFKPVLWL